MSSPRTFTNTNNNSLLWTIIFRLNASTKWLVSVLVTLGVWAPYPHLLQAWQRPYVILGGIAATYGADVLKQAWNQARPPGSPFTDPGMPSSHALTCFFLVAGWQRGVLMPSSSSLSSFSLLGNNGSLALIVLATVISLLRVACGYHTLAQIGVGAALGSVLGVAWVTLAQQFVAAFSVALPALQWLSWLAYGGGSLLFIYHRFGHWLGKDRHL